MGALAHYLEQRGLPTTQISLIAKHTESISPPRALWVPFELGRPLGAPNNPEFQKKVTLAALRLFQAEKGPVLEYFSEEAPDEHRSENKDSASWACPVSFAPSSEEKSEQEELAAAMHKELAELRPWYDLGLEKRGRTAVVTFDPEAAASLFAGYLTGSDPGGDHGELSPGVALRLACQDLKAFYFEAATSRPGAETPESNDFSRWFWNQTAAGQVLQAVKDICAGYSDQELATTAMKFLVPMIK